MHEPLLRFNFGDRRIHVSIGAGGLPLVGATIAQVTQDVPPARVLVVTDETVGNLYATFVTKGLTERGYATSCHRLPPGESSKSLHELGRIFNAMTSAELDRQDLVIALGGGVVSDVAGLAAGTWMRGVRFAICPTTMESDVDACLGGKTAVNLPAGKNLVGVFHQPILVAVDPSCLSTLDRRDISAGLAESVKHALIRSEEFLSWHEANVAAILNLDGATTTELIRRNLEIKGVIVASDVHERSGERALLNFGHTIGHAIEVCADYRLRHGECVSLGMIAALRLSSRRGLLPDAVVDRAVTLLERFALPVKLASAVDHGAIASTIRRDKKAIGGKLRFVLLEGVGQTIIVSDVTDEEIKIVCDSLA